MSNQNITNILVENNRFANVKVNAEQLSAESFKEWSTLMTDLHKSAYSAYVEAENSGCKAEDSTIDKTAIYDALRAIYAYIGKVNGHKLMANEATAIAIIGYSGKRGNADAPELQFANSKVMGYKSMLRKAINPETGLPFNGQESYVVSLNKSIAEATAEVDALIATADMRIKAPTRSNFNAFRLEVEHILARTISGQLTKSWDTLEAEETARKEERKAKNKARRDAKRAEKSDDKIEANTVQALPNEIAC